MSINIPIMFIDMNIQQIKKIISITCELHELSSEIINSDRDIQTLNCLICETECISSDILKSVFLYYMVWNIFWIFDVFHNVYFHESMNCRNHLPNYLEIIPHCSNVTLTLSQCRHTTLFLTIWQPTCGVIWTSCTHLRGSTMADMDIMAYIVVDLQWINPHSFYSRLLSCTSLNVSITI